MRRPGRLRSTDRVHASSDHVKEQTAGHVRIQTTSVLHVTETEGVRADRRSALPRHHDPKRRDRDNAAEQLLQQGIIQIPPISRRIARQVEGGRLCRTPAPFVGGLYMQLACRSAGKIRGPARRDAVRWAVNVP